MTEDAFDLWRRDLDPAPGTGGGSVPPPGQPPGRRRLRPADALAARLFVPGLLGAAIGVLVVVVGSSAALFGPAAALPAVAGFLAALIGRRSSIEAAGWTIMGGISGYAAGFVTVALIVVTDLFECWSSWLADC